MKNNVSDKEVDRMNAEIGELLREFKSINTQLDSVSSRLAQLS